jgi:hypothetical protein
MQSTLFGRPLMDVFLVQAARPSSFAIALVQDQVVLPRHPLG